MKNYWIISVITIGIILFSVTAYAQSSTIPAQMTEISEQVLDTEISTDSTPRVSLSAEYKTDSTAYKIHFGATMDDPNELNFYNPNEIPVLSLPTIEVSRDHVVALCGLEISGYQKINKHNGDFLLRTTIAPPEMETLNVFKINQDGTEILLNTVSSSGKNSCVVIQDIPPDNSIKAELTGEKGYVERFGTTPKYGIHYYSCYSAHFDSKGNFYDTHCIFTCKYPEDKVSEFKIILS